MTDVVLDPMKELHVPQIMAIERDIFDTPWTEEMFRQEIRGIFGSHATVAMMKDKVVGYQVAWFIEDEVHLVNIAVAPNHQARGIGTLLLNHLIEQSLATGKVIITLEVRVGNSIAQAFYRRFFFRAIGVRRSYYSDNLEDALLMVLDLAGSMQRRNIGEGKIS